MWGRHAGAGGRDLEGGAGEAGHEMTLLNIGGGFPAFYGAPVDEPEDYANAVMSMIHRHFGEVQQIMAEPGRGLVAEAGVIAAEVLLVSRKHDNDLHRWVYLDIGMFSGLAEAMGEAIRYRITTDRDHEATGSCILAGPSCDSADVLYERQALSTAAGAEGGRSRADPQLRAYTSTYASVGFNGIPPLDVVVI